MAEILERLQQTAEGTGSLTREGVGESRSQAKRHVPPIESAEILRHSFLRLSRQRTKSRTLEPLSRRRPPSSTGAGVSNTKAFSLVRTRRLPARLTRSSTHLSQRRQPEEGAAAYFFFRRLVFFATTFFAAAFVFRFFAMLPS